MDPIDPISNAQETHEGADPSPGNQEPSQSDDGRKSGAEQRIGELTAKFRGMERQYESVLQQNERLIAMLEARATAPRQEEADPLADIEDEGQREMGRRVLQRATGAVSQAEQRIQQQMQMLELQQLAVQEGFSVEVTQAAKQLLVSWHRSGKTGWVPEDALIYAEARLNRSKTKPQRKASSELEDFTGGGDAVVMAHRRTAAPAPAQREQPLPSNFDDLDPDQQVAIMEKRMGNKRF